MAKKKSAPAVSKLPGVRLPKGHTFGRESPPDRITQANWWKDDLKRLLGSLTAFLQTLVQATDSTHDLIRASLHEQFDEIRASLRKIRRVPRCLQLVLAHLRTAGCGGDPRPLAFSIQQATLLIPLRYLALVDAFNAAVRPRINIEWEAEATSMVGVSVQGGEAGDSASSTPAPKAEPDGKARRRIDTKSLNELDEFVLLALGELKAFNKDNRRTAEQVANHLDAKNDRYYVKKPLATLKQLKFVDSHQGPKGGSWLTAKGKKRFDRATAKR